MAIGRTILCPICKKEVRGLPALDIDSLAVGCVDCGISVSIKTRDPWGIFGFTYREIIIVRNLLKECADRKLSLCRKKTSNQQRLPLGKRRDSREPPDKPRKVTNGQFRFSKSSFYSRYK